MEWALGIESIGGRLMGTHLAADGKSEYVSLEKLCKQGIPSESNLKRKVNIETDFSTWKPANAAEYLKAFGLGLPDGTVSRHHVFEFSEGRTRFLVPALVLMRAIFRPERQLLPAMFSVQALDHCCFVDFSTNPPRPIVHAHWGRSGFRCISESVLAGLTWLTCYPSARRAANSVFVRATTGEIGIDLPTGEIRLIVCGKKIQSTYFVTDITISRIKPCEAPFAFAGELPSEISMITSSNKFDAPCEVHPRRDGETDLNDAEWEKIGPILLDGMRQSSIKLDQRLIFCDVLTKMHRNVPWRKLQCKVGSWPHVQRAYELWHKNGSLVLATELLAQMRKAN